MAKSNLAAVPDADQPADPLKPKLAPFEGQAVIRTAVIVRKTGDGLSDALSVEPVEFHQGDEFTMLVRCKVDKVRFDGVKDTDCLSRVHDSIAIEATIVDEGTGEDYFEAQRAKIEADKIRREKEAGIERLPLEPDIDPDGDPLGVFDDDGAEVDQEGE